MIHYTRVWHIHIHIHIYTVHVPASTSLTRYTYILTYGHARASFDAFRGAHAQKKKKNIFTHAFALTRRRRISVRFKESFFGDILIPLAGFYRFFCKLSYFLIYPANLIPFIFQRVKYFQNYVLLLQNIRKFTHADLRSIDEMTIWNIASTDLSIHFSTVSSAFFSRITIAT